MKKALLTGIILAVVLLAVISTAGCVQQKEVTEDTIDFSTMDVIVEYYAMKNGTTYNVGDTMLVTLPSQPSATEWNVKSCDDGLSVRDDGYVALIPNTLGYKTFTVTALKEGEYSFTLVNDSHEYVDTVKVVKTDEAPLTPRGIFIKEKLLPRDPAPGEGCGISIYGDPSTGYQWQAQETKGLIISEPIYTPLDENGGDSMGGIFTWKVTATAPGKYEFTAVTLRPGDSEPADSVVIPLKFKEKKT